MLTLEPAASVNSSREGDVSHLSSKKNVLPLNLSKNVSQVAMSALASLLRRMRWHGRLAPLVRSIMRRTKARPGTITEQVKFKRPNKDCNSLRVLYAVYKRYATTYDISEAYQTAAWLLVTLSQV